MTQPLNIVWFKRDLRVEDHQPLVLAAQAGPVLPLYIVEPDVWAQPDASGRQWAFAAESLSDLQSNLTRLGQRAGHHHTRQLFLEGQVKPARHRGGHQAGTGAHGG